MCVSPAYIDPICRYLVKVRHRLYEFSELHSLEPAEMAGGITWSIIRSTHDSDEMEVFRPSSGFNPAVTAFLRDRQVECDNRVRNRVPGDTRNWHAQSMFISLALNLGGKNLMNCVTNEAGTNLIIATLRDSCDAVLAGTPPTEEVAKALARLDGLGCGLHEMVA